MKSLFITSLTLSTFLLVGSNANGQSADKAPVHQLRIYEIPKNNRQPFHDRFEEHALRIMKKYSFNIVCIWESDYEDKLEFVYLLEWKDEDTMRKSWEGFMADQEWKDIKKQTSSIHGTFVDRIEDRTLILTDYSPGQKLLVVDEK